MKRVLVCEWPIEETKQQANGQHVMAEFAESISSELYLSEMRRESEEQQAHGGAGPYYTFPGPISARIEERD